MNLGNAIAELRLELNDPATTANPQGKRYSNALFTTWLNAGVQLVYHFRKDLFNQTVVIQATPGDLQKPCGIDRVLKVDGLSDACGNITKPLQKIHKDILSLYPSRQCIATVTPEACPLPTSYALDQSTPGTFTLSPPVAANAEVFYRVTGSVPPQPFDCDLSKAICQSTQVAIPAMSFARHMAYSTESESATSRSLATEHFAIFLKVLGIFKDADKAYCREFCKAA
jgi:hypothetical protein